MRCAQARARGLKDVINISGHYRRCAAAAATVGAQRAVQLEIESWKKLGRCIHVRARAFDVSRARAFHFSVS